MAPFYEQDEIPLPLVRNGRNRGVYEEVDDSLMDELPVRRDRMRPASAGALMGLAAGAAALGVVHLLARAALSGVISRGANRFGLPPEAAIAVAYATFAGAGSMVGASFATVTRYLRRWLPLVIWSLVFFGSVAMLALAGSRTWLHGPGDVVMRAIFAATGAYAFLISFTLPLRRR